MVLSRFCAKLHQLESSVQSLANDGMCALSSYRRGSSMEVGSILHSFSERLSAQTPGREAHVARSDHVGRGTTKQKWPALHLLQNLSHSEQPPVSLLGAFVRPVHAPKRWHANQLCVAVLTHDHWLHCFKVAKRSQAQDVQANNQLEGSRAQSPDARASLEATDLVDTEPSWSLFIPSSTLTVAPGRERTFEVEEVRRGFLGMRSARREMLQADSPESFQQWLAALQGASVSGAASSVRRGSPPSVGYEVPSSPGVRANGVPTDMGGVGQVHVPPAPPNPPPPPEPPAQLPPTVNVPDADVACADNGASRHETDADSPAASITVAERSLAEDGVSLGAPPSDKPRPLSSPNRHPVSLRAQIS